MDRGGENHQGCVEDEVEEGEIVDEGELLEEGEEVEDDVLKSGDDGRDHQKVGSHEVISQRLFCEKADGGLADGHKDEECRDLYRRMYNGVEKNEGQLKRSQDDQGQKDGDAVGFIGPGKHRNSIVSSSEKVFSEELQWGDKEAASKQKREGTMFSKDEENNAVRQPGLGQAIAKHKKENFKRDEKLEDLQDSKKKSAKDGDLADKFIKVVALKADKSEEAAKKLIWEEQVEERKNLQGKSKDTAIGGAIEAGKAGNFEHNMVKDEKLENNEKKFSSKAKMSTIPVIRTSSLFNGKEVDESKIKILGAAKSGSANKGGNKLGESKAVKKTPLKRGKSSGEVWEGFSFQKPDKVKHEKLAVERKAEEKSGQKRKAEEISGGKEEKKESKKRCIDGEKKSTEEKKINSEEEKKSTDAKKKISEEKKSTGEKKNRTEGGKKNAGEKSFEQKSKKRDTEEERISKGREEKVGKKGQSKALEDNSRNIEEKRISKLGEEKDRVRRKGQSERRADDSQGKGGKGSFTMCVASKAKKTNAKKDEKGKKLNSEATKEDSAMGDRGDTRSSAKKVKMDEKSKDNVGVVGEGKRESKRGEGSGRKEASRKCTVEELESWKDEVNDN